MAKFMVLLVACLATASASARMRRDAPAASSPLADIEKHASEFQKTFSEQLNSLANSKNTQEFNKALKEGSDSVLQQLSALSSSLQNALTDANGKAKEALQQTQAQLQRTADELRRSHPEVEQQAAALKDKLQSAVQATVQETQKLAKEVASNMEQTNQKLAPKIKEAYDDFVKQAEQVQKKLHEAATKQ
ncbi:apolipophorin-3-like [Hyposmocoma kahamanoa]|uniref:apolipophorin-3-like n=1 Tax=Hyposmocoma kahamanoa TaxID=1477025 RepID=UPI000E6DA557|nr:apolipophorin-3-like [Hyposmocoma kahamanoa]